MSFNLEAVIPPHGDVDEILGAAKVNGQDDLPAERDDAIAAAIDAVGGIMVAGAVGGAGEHSFRVLINGHVNPNNEPRDGWANDYLNISIFQAKSE